LESSTDDGAMKEILSRFEHEKGKRRYDCYVIASGVPKVTDAGVDSSLQFWRQIKDIKNYQKALGLQKMDETFMKNFPKEYIEVFGLYTEVTDIFHQSIFFRRL
jgi:hypothetical protein